MRTKLTFAIAAFVLLLAAQNSLGVQACVSARFNDWRDLGCRKTPGGAGSLSSGVAGAGGNQAQCNNCEKRQGMPAWSVSEPYLNLWMRDEPLGYLTSSGQEMAFRWTYVQREGVADSDLRWRMYVGDERVQIRMRPPWANASASSAAWCHNWWSEIVFWDTNYECGASLTIFPVDDTNSTPARAFLPFSGAYQAMAFLGEGGMVDFNGASAGAPLGESKIRVQIIGESIGGGPEVPVTDSRFGISVPYPTSGPTWVDNPQYGFRLIYPDGSQDVYGLVWLVGARGCPYPLSDPRCGGFPCGGGDRILVPCDYTSRAYLTQRIDPQGRVTRLGYDRQIQVNQPWYTLRWVVDSDGRTNTYYYNPANRYQLQYIVDAYGRTNSIAYNTEGLLSSITDAAGLSSTFQYEPAVVNGFTNCNSDGSLCVRLATGFRSGWLTNLATPYGNTTFNYFQNQESDATAECGSRAILASEPNGAHQLFYYLHNADSKVASSVPSGQVPKVPGYSFDPGDLGANHPGLNYRNTFHWDRRQFSALSSGVLNALFLPHPTGNTLSNGLVNLTAADLKKAQLKHWLLDRTDLISVAELSSERAPSPDAQGSIEGARTWYDYAGKPSPELSGTETLPGCVAQVLPGGSGTNYVCLDYSWYGFPTRRRESYTKADGSAGVRTNSYQYAANWVDLLSISNSAGQRVNFAWNGSHQPTFITNALGEVASLGWDATTRNLTGLSLPGGLSASLTYYPSNALSANGGLLQSLSIPATGRSVSLTWSNGLVRTMQDDLGLSLTATWDRLNRLTGVIFPDTTTLSNVYTRLDLTGQKDRLGNWTWLGYDALQHLTSITNALGNVTRLSWCDCGGLEGIVDALNHPTVFNYNNQGLLTNAVFADGSQLDYTWDAIGRLVGVADGADRSLSAGYNNQGLLTTLSNAAGRLEFVVYDALNRPLQVTDANNVTVTNQFDLLNRLTGRFWPDGIGEGYGWATNGLVAYTNRNGKITRYARDAAGRPVAVTNANLVVVRALYNSLGRITDLWDGRNEHTIWRYNEYGLLTNKTDALGREVFRYAYNPNGQLTNRWTPQFGNTAYSFDAVGNLRSINYPLSTINYFHDALNRLTNMVDASGATLFSYTETSRLQSEDGPWPDDTLSLGYVQGLRTLLSIQQSINPPIQQSYTWDSAWRLQSLSSPAGAFGYDYDAQRSTLPTLVTLPNSAWQTNHFDSLARLDYTALSDRWGHVLDSYAYGHDLLGLRTNITRDFGLANSSVAVGYDNVGQLVSWSARESGGGLRLNEQLGFFYDAAGNLRYRTNGALVQTFTVDSANELTNVMRAGTLTVSGATPGPAANVTVNGQPAERYGDFTFAAAGLTLTNGLNTFTNIAQRADGLRVTNILSLNLPVSVNLQFDLNGNLTNDGTRSFTYNAENQLATNWVAEAWKSEFVYDGLGRRRIERDYGWQGGQWVKTNELRFIYDGYQPVQERDANNAVLVTYTRGLDLGGGLRAAGGIGGLLARTGASGSTFYHADGGGNITALMDTGGSVVGRAAYTPFGDFLSRQGLMLNEGMMGFSSMPQARGIVFYPLRSFMPGGPTRWLTRDPIGERGGINLYGFVGNNPLSFIDPYGEDLRLAGASGSLQMPGPLGYAQGDTVLENLAAGTYNVIPLAGNGLNAAGSTLMNSLSALDQAVEGFLTWATGDPQLAQGLNNVLAVTPIGWPEDAAKAGRLCKAAQEAAKAREWIKTTDFVKDLRAQALDYFRRNARNLETGQHGDVYKKAGNYLIQYANENKNVLLPEFVDDLKKEGNRLIEYGNSVSHK